MKGEKHCSRSWPTDLPLMCCLQGKSRRLRVPGGLGLQWSLWKFYDQKMWGLVCGQKQCWRKVQNEKLCQDKGLVNHKTTHSLAVWRKEPKAKKVTTGLTTGWSPFYLMLPWLAATCWNQIEVNTAASSIHCLRLGLVLWSLKSSLQDLCSSVFHPCFFPLNWEFRAKLPAQLQPRAGEVLADLQNNCGFSRIEPSSHRVKLLKLLCTYFKNRRKRPVIERSVLDLMVGFVP